MDKFSIGNKIRYVRKHRGLTQKELGALCNIDEANIRKYELGKQTPRFDTLEKISNALNISTGFFDQYNTTDDFLIYDNSRTKEEKNKIFPILQYESMRDNTDWVKNAILYAAQAKRINLNVLDVASSISDFSNDKFGLDKEGYHVIQDLVYCFEQLNEEGKRKVFSRLYELLETPKYTKKEE